MKADKNYLHASAYMNIRRLDLGFAIMKKSFVTVVNLRFLGDLSVMKPAPGVMTKFLTGTDHQT